MNQTSVNFLIEYFKRIMDKETKDVKKRVEEKFLIRTQKMIDDGIITSKDLGDAIKALDISMPKKVREASVIHEDLHNFLRSREDPCVSSASGGRC